VLMINVRLYQKITDELKDLNKVKSQMVWLLKQVRAECSDSGIDLHVISLFLLSCSGHHCRS
jgi:hypothetical protein